MAPVTSRISDVIDEGNDGEEGFLSDTSTPHGTSGVSSTPSSATTTRTLQVGNFMVETIDEAMPKQDQGPLYTKESRDTMTPEKLNDLYKEAVKPSQAKYDFTSMTLTDEKRLDDLYNMNNNIDSMIWLMCLLLCFQR